MTDRIPVRITHKVLVNSSYTSDDNNSSDKKVTVNVFPPTMTEILRGHRND